MTVPPALALAEGLPGAGLSLVLAHLPSYVPMRFPRAGTAGKHCGPAPCTAGICPPFRGLQVQGRKVEVWAGQVPPRPGGT